MLRNYVRLLFVVLALLSSNAIVPEVQAQPNPQPTISSRPIRATYTVWYKAPGRRWTGIAKLSYYHACRTRDDYLAKGWSAYIERE